MAVITAFRNAESRLRAFVRRYVGSDFEVDDICQETVTRALEAERSREIESPEAFLYGVARNVIRKQLDKESRSLIEFVADFSADEYPADGPSEEQLMHERERMLLFAEAVATLPNQCQRVFLMRKVYGFSHKEISARLQISVSTVEKHVAAGLKRCMDEIERRQTAESPASSVYGSHESL